MIGIGSTPVSATRPANTEMIAGVFASSRAGGDVEGNARLRQALDHGAGEFPLRVGDRDLDVDVPAPGGDLPRLHFHLAEIVGENFERDRPVRNRREHVARKGLVIGDSRLLHQRRVGGEPFDHRIRRHFPHAGEVRAIGEQLHLQFLESAQRVPP